MSLHEILGISCLSFLMVVVVKWVEPIKTFFKLKRLKPFDCEYCTSLHLGWTYSYFINNCELLTALATGAITATLTIFITHYANR